MYCKNGHAWGMGPVNHAVNFASVSVESVNYPSSQFGHIRPLALFASVFLRCH